MKGLMEQCPHLQNFWARSLELPLSDINREVNKKTVLSQGNRAIPQLFLGLKLADNIHYKFTITSSQASKARFRAPNIPAQNRI